MPTEPAVVKPSDLLWRVERSEPPLRFSRINALDAALDRAGNCFDVPGGGVLYGATDPSGAFAETLAGFRPSAKIIAALAAAPAEPGMRPPGTVPTEWRTARRLRAFETIDRRSSWPNVRGTEFRKAGSGKGRYVRSALSHPGAALEGFWTPTGTSLRTGPMPGMASVLA
jgi:hypothetical protein